jgi:hypothetical protein
MFQTLFNKYSLSYLFGICFLFFLLLPASTFAATLSLSPSTGVYKTGQTFTVNVVVNTTSASVNASDGTVSFDPHALSVVAVTRSSSIFNLWTAEPAFSNAAGTISFSGGVPTGYTGAGGVVMSITFRSLNSGTAQVSLTNASVLAADGRGTNVLNTMNGGTYTIAAVDSQPPAEVIVDYVPLANTPAAPKITSDTQSDPSHWYTNKNAVLNWSIPSDVISVRTSLDTSAVSVPTKVYETPIKTITLSNLDEGISYFHLQFKNKDGWGKIANYRLAIDSEKPKSFTITSPEGADLSNPIQTLHFVAVDATSPVTRYKIQVDATSPYEYTATSSISDVTLKSLAPGAHTIVAEGFDAAGNSLVATYTFTILSFDKPVITEYPHQLSAGVIPVIRGTTRPQSLVTITLTLPTGVIATATTTSSANGQFTFIPATAFSVGVYSVSAVATDQFGAESAPSDVVKIVVEQPGYMVIGSMLINILSLLIPLAALCVFGWIVLLYGIHRVRLLRSRIRRESREATQMAEHEFAAIKAVLEKHEKILVSSRKTGKLTGAEAELFDDIRSVVSQAESRVEKEVADVAALVGTK